MEISLKFGMFFLIYCFITGIAMLARPRTITRAIDEIFTSDSQILIVGFMALIFGAFIVSFHVYYQWHWPLLITIFGWLAVIKGVIYLLEPRLIKTLYPVTKTENGLRITGVVSLLFSGFFAYNLLLEYTVGK